MDGNGRWATRRGLSRLRGHEAGVEAIRRVVEAAPDQGVGTLTLYAFSTDNWRRPRAEVAALMALLRFYLANEVESLVKNGVRLTVIGRRDRLPDGHRGGDRARGSGDRGRRGAASADRGRLLLARCDSERRREARRHHRADAANCSRNSSPARPGFATSTSSSAPAARSGCPTSCSGRAPTPNCISPSGCGRISTRRISRRRWRRSTAANAASAASSPCRWSRCRASEARGSRRSCASCW